jgi:NAD(P)-dependent dehydrogenase (short-subunit alcohol dehydrogenase family)
MNILITGGANGLGAEITKLLALLPGIISKLREN